MVIIMTSNYIKSDIARFWDVLGHEGLGLTEVRAINPNSKEVYGIGFFDDKEAYIQACINLNEKANLYAGKNPRPFRFKKFYRAYNKIFSRQKTGGRSKDIEYITAINLDIDPIRPTGQASTEQEHNLAMQTAIKLSYDYENSIPYSTGNGAALLFPVKPYKITGDYRELELKNKSWEEQIRKQIDDVPALELDSMYDLARIIKIPGTLSIKGDNSEKRPYRIARFLDREGYSPVLDEILALEVPYFKSGDSISLSEIPQDIPEKFFEVMQRIPKIKATWNKKRYDLKDQSRSGYDLALADLLVINEFSDSDIAAILRKSPSGKGSDASEKYLELTISKARAMMEKHRKGSVGNGRFPRTTSKHTYAKDK